VTTRQPLSSHTPDKEDRSLALGLPGGGVALVVSCPHNGMLDSATPPSQSCVHAFIAAWPWDDPAVWERWPHCASLEGVHSDLAWCGRGVPGMATSGKKALGCAWPLAVNATAMAITTGTEERAYTCDSAMEGVVCFNMYEGLLHHDARTQRASHCTRPPCMPISPSSVPRREGPTALLVRGPHGMTRGRAQSVWVVSMRCGPRA